MDARDVLNDRCRTSKLDGTKDVVWIGEAGIDGEAVLADEQSLGMRLSGMGGRPTEAAHLRERGAGRKCS